MNFGLIPFLTSPVIPVGDSENQILQYLHSD